MCTLQITCLQMITWQSLKYCNHSLTFWWTFHGLQPISLQCLITHPWRSGNSLPVYYEDAIKELTELLNMGIVEHTDSPYVFPLVAVLKKKDKSVRLCVDYRKLNAITLVQVELMPNERTCFPDSQTSSWNLTCHVATGRYLWHKRQRSSLPSQALLGTWLWKDKVSGLLGRAVHSLNSWGSWHRADKTLYPI